MDISGTQLRAVRAALFTALVVTLSSASHVLLSRVPLPMGTVAVIAAAVFVVAYALAGRERGFGRIAALLIPLELAADTVFTTGQTVCYGRAGGPVAGPLRSVGFDVLCAGDNVGTPLARVADTDRVGALLAHAGPSTAWLLLAAHIGVGLLAAAWLRRGERALGRLLDALTAAGFRPLLLAAAAVTVRSTLAVRRLPRPAQRVATPRARLFAHSLGRRGPPSPLAFA
uniref:Integral membrane protein n=1 Tax=Streptomyces sp. NBC_00093 TaxID=2975649 RepID=A0AAU2AA01_9ACTN